MKISTIWKISHYIITVKETIWDNDCAIAHLAHDGTH